MAPVVALEPSQLQNRLGVELGAGIGVNERIILESDNRVIAPLLVNPLIFEIPLE